MSNFGGGESNQDVVRTNYLFVNSKQISTNGVVGSSVNLKDIRDNTLALSTKADINHSHEISSITNLQSELNGKAPTNHNHEINNINNLQSALDSKAPISHNHEISNVNGLQTALDGKALTNHTHTIENITNLQTELDGKASTSHNHEINNVNGLQTALDGKANTSHNHEISQINNLQNIIDGKLNTNDGSVNKMWEIVDGTGGFEKRVQLLRSVVGGSSNADYELSIAGVDADRIYANDFITKSNDLFEFFDTVGDAIGFMAKGTGAMTGLKYLKIAGGAVGGLLLTNLAASTLNELGDLFSSTPQEEYDNNQISVNTLTGDLMFSTFRKFDIDPTKGINDNEWGDAIGNVIGWQGYVPKEWFKVALENAHIDMYSIKLRNYTNGFSAYGNRKQELNNQNDTLYYDTVDRLYSQNGRLYFNGSSYALQSEIPNLSGYALVSQIPSLENYYNKSQVDALIPSAFNGGMIYNPIQVIQGGNCVADFPYFQAKPWSGRTNPSFVISGGDNCNYADGLIRIKMAKSGADMPDATTRILLEGDAGIKFYDKDENELLHLNTTQADFTTPVFINADQIITQTALNSAISAIPATDLSNYYNKSEVDGLISGSSSTTLQTNSFVEFNIGGIQPTLSQLSEMGTSINRLYVNTDNEIVYNGQKLMVLYDLNNYYNKTEVDNKYYLSGSGMTALKVNFDTTSGPYNNDVYFASNIAHKWYLDFPYTNTLVQDSQHLAMKLHRNISYYENIPQFNTILEFGESGQTRYTDFEYKSLRFDGTNTEIASKWNASSQPYLEYSSTGGHHFKDEIMCDQSITTNNNIIINSGFDANQQADSNSLMIGRWSIQQKILPYVEYQTLMFSYNLIGKWAILRSRSFSYLNYTHYHKTFVEDTTKINSKDIGKIVEMTGKIRTIGDKEKSISDALPLVKLCDKYKSKKVFGVIAKLDDTFDNEGVRSVMFENGQIEQLDEVDKNKTIIRVNTSGDGLVCVVFRMNENIEAGDYITTYRFGYGIKQDDDLNHNYTIAKATEDLLYNDVREEIELDGIIYRTAMLGVIYLS